LAEKLHYGVYDFTLCFKEENENKKIIALPTA
jgi:hypothetical protein